MNQKRGVILSIFISLALVSGCGVVNHKASAVAGQLTSGHTHNPQVSTASMSLGNNSPFTIKVKDDLTQPAEKWDAKTVNDSLYNSVKVLNQNGKAVTLNVSNTPLLFEAYWCPHCQRTIVMLSANRSSLNKVPTIISTGFAPNTSIKQAVYISDQEFKALDLHKFKVYYLLNHSLLSKYVTDYPTLVFQKNGHTERFAGEHTLNLWERALS